jgi:hypothetical protein
MHFVSEDGRTIQHKDITTMIEDEYPELIKIHELSMMFWYRAKPQNFKTTRKVMTLSKNFAALAR